MGPDSKKKDNWSSPQRRQVSSLSGKLLTLQQVKLVEEGAPGFLDSHRSVCDMIQRGNFKDGTNMIHDMMQNKDGY